MTIEHNQEVPYAYYEIDTATKESGFTMASDMLTCSLLRTLTATKQGGKLLELGTGTGLSTAWILDGMSASASLTSIDYDAKYLGIAREHLGNDTRLELVLADGEDWVASHLNERYDYIFADTWHGKYLMLEEVLNMLKSGGIYIVDDMLPQPNWPDGHAEKALNFVKILEDRTDLYITKQHWATGIIIAVKK
jgi:predicted O-methyltransferase YrrM